MKTSELIDDRVVTKNFLADWMSGDLCSIADDGGILIVMANLRSRITDLPANIILWTRPDEELSHTEYRLKVTKDHIHSLSYSIGSEPKIVDRPRTSKKYQLDAYEKTEIVKFIKKFYSLIVSYVDGKITADDLEIEIQKIIEV